MSPESFAEYRDIGGSEPLRQGDVLEAVDIAASKWKRHLMVITADCDFANHKNHGRVTCVPLLTAEEYLVEMQLPKVRERIVKKHLTALRTIVAQVAAPNITDERLREWVSEEDPGAVLAGLGLDGADAETAQMAIESIRLIDEPRTTLKEHVEALVEVQMRGANPPKRANAIKNVLEPLQDSYASPPGDALFLTTLAPTHDIGYFAYLRHLEQIWEPEISTSPGRTDAKYSRIARLQDRFTHALVQRFATVFMSIGLPSEYEGLRDLHSEILGESFK